MPSLKQNSTGWLTAFACALVASLLTPPPATAQLAPVMGTHYAAIRLISENPYRLARDIRGIGFRTADQIAAKLGIEKTALIRVRAGISYALAEAMASGWSGSPGGACTRWKAPPCHGAHPLRTLGRPARAGDRRLRFK
jgi:hypothetical protein